MAGRYNDYKTMIEGKNIFCTSEIAFAVDRIGQVVVWNQAAEQTLGYAGSEALGQKCWELLSGRDVFGNRSCCEGCPIRTTAFCNEPINRFHVDFKTASEERKRYTLSTRMLFNAPGKEVFVHLCHPEANVTDSAVTEQVAHPTVAKNQTRALTPRETEVLTLLHKGMTIPDIADAMRISSVTVRNHVQHILLKFHVHSRFEAVALGRKLGLI